MSQQPPDLPKTSMAAPPAIIFGTGKNVGASDIEVSVATGYCVTTGSCSLASAPAPVSDSAGALLAIQVELSRCL